MNEQSLHTGDLVHVIGYERKLGVVLRLWARDAYCVWWFDTCIETITPFIILKKPKEITC